MTVVSKDMREFRPDEKVLCIFLSSHCTLEIYKKMLLKGLSSEKFYFRIRLLWFIVTYFVTSQSRFCVFVFSRFFFGEG